MGVTSTERLWNSSYWIYTQRLAYALKELEWMYVFCIFMMYLYIYTCHMYVVHLNRLK